MSDARTLTILIDQEGAEKVQTALNKIEEDGKDTAESVGRIGDSINLEHAAVALTLIWTGIRKVAEVTAALAMENDEFAASIGRINEKKDALIQKMSDVVFGSKPVITALSGVADIIEDVVDGISDWVDKNPELTEQLTGNMADAIVNIAQGTAVLAAKLGELSIHAMVAIKGMQMLDAALHGDGETILELMGDVVDLSSVLDDLKEGEVALGAQFTQLRADVSKAKNDMSDGWVPAVEDATDATEDLEAALDKVDLPKVADNMGELADASSRTAYSWRDMATQASTFAKLVDQTLVSMLRIEAAKAGEWGAAIGGRSSAVDNGEPGSSTASPVASRPKSAPAGPSSGAVGGSTRGGVEGQGAFIPYSPGQLAAAMIRAANRPSVSAQMAALGVG